MSNTNTKCKGTDVLYKLRLEIRGRAKEEKIAFKKGGNV